MLKPIGLALAATLCLFATQAAAQSTEQSGQAATAGRIANRNDSSPAAASSAKVDLTIDKGHHEQGQKEAPAVAQAANLPCTVTDSYFVGDSTQKDAAGKETKAKIYEVACQEGLGYALLAGPTPPAKFYDCISLLSSPSLRCRLPANLDPKVEIAPAVSLSGRTCAISGVRGVGATPSGDAYFEVACSDQLGFLIKRSGDGKTVTANDCSQTIGTNVECQLTTKAQIDAQMKATIDRIVASSGRQCTVSGSRVVGVDTKGGMTYYEIACGTTGGFMASVDKSGGFLKAIDCAKADSLAGGCTLTDVVTAQTNENSTYTRLARAANFPCDVTKYRYIGTDKSGSEVVELACSNRPDGGLGVFPGDNSPGKVYDCVRAGGFSQTCKLTDTTLVYPRYTQALAAKGKSTCTVSNAHWLGHSAQNNTDLIETACSDGLPGWVVELSPANQVVDLLTCGQARGSGLQCTLPGNTK